MKRTKPSRAVGARFNRASTVGMMVWRNLTAHLLRSALTAMAIALGVGMVLAASIVGQAANQSAAALTGQGPRIDLELVARDGGLFDAAVLETLRASPDVECLSPSLRIEGEVASGDGAGLPTTPLVLLGVDPEAFRVLNEPELTNGAFLDAPDSIVLPVMMALDLGLNVGDEVTVRGNGREMTLTVSGRLKAEAEWGDLAETMAAYVPLRTAQHLRDAPGQIARAAIALRDGVDIESAKETLAAQLDADLSLVRAVKGGGITGPTIAIQIGLAMVGLIMLFAAAFVIMNAFAMSVTARTREIGALRALGMTRRQVLGQVLAEAGLLGLTGAALGLLAGMGLAWGVMHLRGTLDEVAFAVPWWGVGVSAAMGIGVTLVGALQPAWRASSVPPLAALRAAGATGAGGWYVRRGGRVGAVLLLGLLPGLIAAAFFLKPDFFQSFLFLGLGLALALLGMALSMPALVAPLARFLRPLLIRRLGTAGRLAADNLSRNRLRTALTAGALTIGLTTIIATSTIMTASLKAGLQAFFGLFHEDGMIIPDIPALIASGEVTIENSMSVAGIPLDPALVETVEALGPLAPGQRALNPGTLVYYGFAPVPDELSTMPGAPGTFVDPEVFLPLGNFDFFEGDPDSALEMMRHGRALLLMPIIAERLGVGVGDEILVETPRQGTVAFTVAGIGGTSTNFTVFSYADGETYFGLTHPSWLGIALPQAGSSEVEAMLARVGEAIAPFEDVVVFDMRDSGVGGLIQIVDQLQVLLNALLLLAVIVAGLGVVNTMVINVAERGREIGLLRAVGAAQRQVRQMIVAEAAALGLMAALVAAVLGLVVLALYVMIILPNGAASVGIRADWEAIGLSLWPGLHDWSVAATASLVLGPLVAALAAYFPARQAAALDVVEATRSERVALKRTKPSRAVRARFNRAPTVGMMAWRNLTAHPLRSALTAMAIALGVGMMLAAAVVGQAAGRSAGELAQEGPRVDLEVFSRDGAPFDAAVLETLRASPDVARLAPSLCIDAEGIEPLISRLALCGVDPAAYLALHAPELAGGNFLDGPETVVLPMAVALDHGLRPGDEVTLQSGDRTVALAVSGRLSMEARPAEALVPLGVAQALGGTPGQIERIEIALQPRADLGRARAELSELVGSALVVVRAEAGGGIGFNTALIQGGVAMVGLMILFAAGFVILNAFAMSVAGRTREIGALRALGMTRRQVIQTVLLEAGLLGLMGAAAGALIGLALAWIVMDVRGLLDKVAFAVPWWGLVLSPLIGLTVTLAGALQPAWRAGRVSPIEAIRAGTREASGWYARSGGRAGALLLILLLPALAAYGLIGRPDIWKAMAATGLGIAGLLAAAVLLLPALVGRVGSVCRVLLSRRFGAAGRLAADNLRRNRQRSALTAGALVAGLTMIVAASGLLPLFLEGSIGLIGSVMHEDMVVTADLVAAMTSGEMTLENIYRSMADLSVDPAVADRLSPLVAAGQIELQRVGIAAVPPELATVPTGRESAGMFVDLEPFIRIGDFDFYQGDAETALQLARRGRAVLLQPLAAERLGVGVGDALPIKTSQGEVTFTVAGIGGSGLFSPIFPYADGEEYFELAGLFQLGVIVAEGQDVDAVKARVEEALEGVPGVLVLEDVGGIIDEAAAMFDRFRALLNALLLLAVIVAALGVVNTMVINVTERGREIGLLRAVGATQRQVRQMIVAEAAALGLMAALTAIALGLLMVLVYAMVVMPNGWGALGMRSDWATIRGQLIAALTDMGLAAALAVIAGPVVAALAAYIPARQAAVLDVVEATRSERVALKRAKPSRAEARFNRAPAVGVGALAWRNMQQSRTRTALSALAVALGVAMTVAADLTSSAILNALAKSEDAQIFMTGLLDQLDRMLVLVGVMITVAAGFLVFNAFAMSVTQRQRQIGALRSLGMTRRQVIRLVLAEALLTGGAGTLLGLIGGPVLGRGTIALMKTMLGEGIFVFAAGSASPSILLLAAGLGVGITLLSVLIPAWRAARVSPLTALREEMASGIERNPVGRLLLGLLVAVLLFAYLALAPPGEWVSPPWDTGLTVLFVALWLGCLALILPALIGGVGRWARRPLARLWGAAGRLTADNVRRGRGRVTLTVLTLAVALTMIGSLTGFFQFVMHELFWSKMELIGAQGALGLAPIDIMAGMSAYSDMESIAIPPEALAAVRQTAAGRAEIVEFHFVIVPELSFFGNSYFSFIVEPDDLRRSSRSQTCPYCAFRFIEGDWQTALSIMDAGCGALVMPLVAGKNGVSLGETIRVSGAEGPVACTVAGIGESFVGASIISSAGAAAFRVTDTSIVAIIPLPGEDREALKADLTAAIDGFQNAELMEIENLTKLQLEVIDALPGMFNALLLLAILAAALGVVNTTVMSVAERRRELGLLRAVGATRRQVSRVVTGEAALMGLVGGGLGLVAGVGITVILVVTYGGNAWGVPDLDLWPAAWRSVQPVLLNGLIGLIAAPFICAGAAWLPVRAILRGSAVETLKPTVLSSEGASRRLAPTLRVLAWRNLSQARTRTILSALAVALGVAMIVAAGVTSNGVRAGVQAADLSKDATAWITDLFETALNAVGVVILLAAGFVILNSFAMSVTRRRRQIGALRALGMTRHQVMRLILAEALLIGGGGTLLGLLAGPLLGGGLLALTRGLGIETGRGSLSPGGLALAIALGMGITLLSVLVPARRAMRIAPLVALQRQRVVGIERGPGGRAIWGMLILAGLAVYLVIAPPGEWALPPWNTLMPLSLSILWAVGLSLILPTSIAWLGHAARKALARPAGAVGRLVADNLLRERRRVILTVLAFAVGLTMIVSMTGIVAFTFTVLFEYLTEGALAEEALIVVPFDLSSSGNLALEVDQFDLETLFLSQEALADFYALAEGRAQVGEGYAVMAPEIGAMTSNYPSFIYDLDTLSRGRFYSFVEGSWDTALPVMEEGCGLLLHPGVAVRNNAGIGDKIILQAIVHPIECTVAGLGAGGYHPASFISPAAQEAFDVTRPAALLFFPLPGTDREGFEAELLTLAEHHGVLTGRSGDTREAFSASGDLMVALMSNLLLLAVLAAAMGMVNTTAMSVAERRHELGLLRAVGATRRQVTAVVVGEAALVGLVGGLLGLAAGGGISVIYAVATGGKSMGISNFPLWRAAWQATRPAVLTGLLGLVVAPIVSAGAAWLPVRAILRGSAVETLKPTVLSSEGASRRRAPTLRVLAWRNLSQARTRTILSALAVALGVAVIVATGVIRAGVESGIEDTLQESVAFVADMVGMGLSIAGVMILVAAGFLIFNAFGMAVTERRRQIGSLRSLGATRRQVLRLVLLEALIIGGLGTGLGLVAGPMLGHAVLAGMQAAGFEVGSGSASPSGALLALAMGLAITLGSVWLPARRAARISPLAALKSEAAAGLEGVSRVRVVAALILLAALWGYLIIAPPGEWVLEPWNYAVPFLLLIPWLGALFSLAPAFIGGVGRAARAPLARLWKASGSLMADNLRRGRGRVAVTALTFAVSVMTVVGVTGVFNFFGKALIDHAQETRLQNGLVPGWSIGAADFTQGVMNVGGIIDTLKPEVIAEVYRAAEGRATVGVERPVVVPELAAVLVPNYFSSMIDLNLLAVPGDVRFIEGNLESALPVMEAGCGVLLAPGAAARNGVGVGETLTIQGKRGPLDCTVAGVVAAGMVPVSFISPAVADALEAGDPTSIIIFPRPGIDRAALEADLRAIDEKYGDDAWLLSWQENVATVAESTDRVLSLMSSLLVLAVVAAALGLINTTVMSVTERRQELGLFRAVGATRRQGMAVIAGEAALIGLVGSVLGLIAGAGIGAIFALAHGGKVWGYPEIDLWAAAWRSVRPALRNGLVGLVAAPLLSAAAAWLPGRRILRGSVVETLEGERQMQNAKADRASWQRGSIRARFVLGTAALVLVLLLGLIAAVTAHERGYLEDWIRQTLALMVEGQAGLIEMNLPDDTRSLALADLELGEFDADALLRFRALMDDMSAFGLQELAVTDGDNVVLLGLDPRQIGTLLPALETPDETAIVSEREAGAWQMRAAAPIRNDAGQTLGSVRVTVSLAELQGLLDKTRSALWAAGGIAAALALALSWLLTAPLASATARLAAQANRVAGGEYVPIARRRGRWAWLTERTSLRLRLTVALVAVVALLVGVLEVVTVPIQRRHVEEELKEGMVTAAEWLGQAAAEGLDAGLLPGQSLSLESLFELIGTTDWGGLQELTEKTRSEDVAYVALVDRDGVIQFSDQFSLIGETASVPTETQVEETRWRDEEIWAISTPLRGGQDGEPVGALQMGLRRAGVEAFLRESRTLFRLSGLIALLAGVLLAQAVGGAVTAPVREMAAGVRRVGQGDLSVRFRADTRDELALLAGAFNQMVAGLREREWLRDMFGRFVSREVAEAIRTGQVQLEGENRVVSVLFCDIRGFTTRSEKSTPAEVVALLNEYLPVVVDAAQAHAGTVNKFGGDSTLIIYGAPKALQESAYQAVLTALEMRANLARLNERLASRGEEPIRIGVGINTGVALAGAVGPRERQEYTVIGDAVNLASRIEALNKQYPAHDVLISEWTYEALGSRRSEFVFEDLGALPIRGKAQPVRVWAVKGFVAGVVA